VSLAEVRFQNAAVRMLRAAVAGDHVPHAYLFSGPRGVGKALAARQFAKLLLCSKPQGKGESIDACDKCDHCQRIERGTHPDIYWFRKEEDRNDFRINLVVRGRGQGGEVVATTVTESVVLHPMEAARTVTVLDDAETLNRAAANALLKTLEEPAPHAVLILVCSDPSQLPGTILSRCQWVRFQPLPEELVAAKLAEVLAKRAPPEYARGKKALPPRPVTPEEIAFICRFAGGSIEQAGRLAESGLWDLKRLLVQALPEMDEAVALDQAEAISEWSRAQVKQQHARPESPEGNAIRRASARLALAAVASAFRDASLLAAEAPASVRLTNSDQSQTLRALAAWSPEACSHAVSMLSDAQAQIARYVHTELATENALIQVSRLRPTVHLDKSANRG
jgi:DNA polymerase III subunit delta'